MNVNYLARLTAKRHREKREAAAEAAHRKETEQREEQEKHQMWLRKEADSHWNLNFKSQIEDAADEGLFETTFGLHGADGGNILKLISDDLQKLGFKVKRDSRYVPPEHSSGDSSSGEFNHDGYHVYTRCTSAGTKTKRKYEKT